MKHKSLATGMAVWAMVVTAGRAAELEGPIPILSGGRPIDTEHVGHAAPCVVDFDGDGCKDLLVGEMYQGRLRIYRNVGKNNEPQFEGFVVFQDGASQGRVPAG